MAINIKYFSIVTVVIILGLGLLFFSGSKSQITGNVVKDTLSYEPKTLTDNTSTVLEKNEIQEETPKNTTGVQINRTPTRLKPVEELDLNLTIEEFESEDTNTTNTTKKKRRHHHPAPTEPTGVPEFSTSAMILAIMGAAIGITAMRKK